jgi:hypothetical protein
MLLGRSLRPRIWGLSACFTRRMSGVRVPHRPLKYRKGKALWLFRRSRDRLANKKGVEGFESLVQYLSLIFKDFMVFRSAIESTCLKERRSHRTNACATLCSGSVAEQVPLTNRNSKGVVTSVVASEKNLSPWTAAQLVAHAPASRDIRPE